MPTKSSRYALLQREPRNWICHIQEASPYTSAHMHRLYTHRPQMWKQLGRVFVVGRVLSCHCMRQLLMGNIKPRRGWSFRPQLWPRQPGSVSADNRDPPGWLILKRDEGSRVHFWLKCLIGFSQVSMVYAKKNCTAPIHMESQTKAWTVLNTGGPSRAVIRSMDSCVLFCWVPFMGKGLLAFMYLAEMFVLRNDPRERSNAHMPACGSFQTGQHCWRTRLGVDWLTPGLVNRGFIAARRRTGVGACRWNVCGHALFSTHMQNLEKPRAREAGGRTHTE